MKLKMSPERTALIVVGCTILAAIPIGLIILEGMRDYGVTLQVTAISLNHQHFNVTFLVVEAPDYGVLFEAVSAPGTYKEFTPTTLYTGDQLSLSILHQDSVDSLPIRLNLHGGHFYYPMMIEEEGTTYEF